MLHSVQIMKVFSLLFVFLFSFALFTYAQSAQDYYKSAMIKFVNKRYSESVEDFTKAIKVKPNYIDAYFNRGIAYEYMGESNRALKDYANVIKLDPGMNEAYINRALLYKKLEKYTLAIKDLDRAIALRPDFAFAYLYRADIHYIMGDLGASAKDYRKVLNMLPNYIKAQRRLSEILYRQGKYTEALEFASKLCMLESDKADNFLQRAEIFIALQRFEAACKDLEHAKQLGSEAAEPLIQSYCQ